MTVFDDIDEDEPGGWIEPCREPSDSPDPADWCGECGKPLDQCNAWLNGDHNWQDLL